MRRTIALIAVAALALSPAALAMGVAPTAPIEPTQDGLFQPVPTYASTPTPPPVAGVVVDDLRRPERSRPVVPVPTPPVGTSTPKPPRSPAPRADGSVTGAASWYCKAGVSACHYKYPPGSIVAAACHKLRVAMGGDADKYWRNKVVTVTRLDDPQDPDRHVAVKLVDYCGSSTKTIDLYWAPMSRLGGTGVLKVKVTW